MNTELDVITALRSDLALQIARAVSATGETQVVAARRLGIPQPTLSKIMRGNVADLSLELLIRVAVRAGLQLVMQTGKDASEAGVFVSRASAAAATRTRSRTSEASREALLKKERTRTPQERLEAQLRHSELLAQLNKAAREGAR